MSEPIQDEGLALPGLHDSPHSDLHEHEVPGALEDRGSSDWLEVQSIKWNVARIVRLSSGKYALLTHYRENALALIKMGTIEEIAPYIPTADECAVDYSPRRPKAEPKKLTTLNLADLGL
jgi:ABC-type transporter Mla MlaB component